MQDDFKRSDRTSVTPTDEFSLMAMEYKTIMYLSDRESVKRREVIFKAIYNQYLPFVNTQFNKLPKDLICSESEFRSLYMEAILVALGNYQGRAKFLPYLHQHLIGLKRTAKREMSVVNHESRYTNLFIQPDMRDDEW